MSLTLRGYQQPHFAKLLTSLISNGFAHDGSETGCGKTYVGAGLLRALSGESLIIAPLSVVPTWEEVLQGFGVYDYTVMNYESAWRKLGEVKPYGSGSFFRFHRQYKNIVFDETQRCGGETTLNSKMLIAGKRSGATLLTQSATIADSPLRMKAFGFAAGLHDLRDYTQFLLRCQCKPGTFGGWTFSGKAHPLVLQGLQEEIYGKGKGSRLRKAEIPGFPKMTTEVRLLGSPDKQLLRMDEEMRTYYNQKAVAAVNLTTRIEARKRVAEAAGEVAEPTGEELARMMFIRQSLETAKVPLIADMIEDALEESRVAIFCNFNETIEQLKAIATRHKWTYGVIRGRRDGAVDGVRADTIKAFQRNELDVIFCNIQAGGVGISLHDPVTQVPRTSIICPTFSGDDLKQVLGRAHRDGGGFSRNIMIYFEGTFEGVVARIVRGKLDNIDLINDAELSGNFRFAA